MTDLDTLTGKIGSLNESLADKKNQRKAKKRAKYFVADGKINVLVMGVSGVGKSTLINAVVGKEVAKTGSGDAVTKVMKIYEPDDLPFRLADTVGFEYGFMRQQKIKRQIEKWSDKGLKMEDSNKVIHAIWYCIDTQSQRISKSCLNSIAKVAKMWKDVPIIVVFTKNYSKDAAEENEKVFRKVLFKCRKKNKLNIKAVVSVLAKEFVIDKHTVIGAYGVDKLVEETVAIMPEAVEINDSTMERMTTKVTRRSAESYVYSAAFSAALVSLLPTLKSDSEYLTEIQESMLSRIAEEFSLESSDVERIKKLAAGADKTGKAGKKLVRKKFIRRIPFIKSIVAAATTYSFGELALAYAERLS